jgi:hypothetical protein
VGEEVVGGGWGDNKTRPTQIPTKRRSHLFLLRPPFNAHRPPFTGPSRTVRKDAHPATRMHLRVPLVSKPTSARCASCWFSDRSTPSSLRAAFSAAKAPSVVALSCCSCEAATATGDWAAAAAAASDAAAEGGAVPGGSAAAPVAPLCPSGAAGSNDASMPMPCTNGQTRGSATHARAPARGGAAACAGVPGSEGSPSPA